MAAAVTGAEGWATLLPLLRAAEEATVAAGAAEGVVTKAVAAACCGGGAAVDVWTVFGCWLEQVQSLTQYVFYISVNITRGLHSSLDNKK